LQERRSLKGRPQTTRATTTETQEWGFQALFSNTTGFDNTASGFGALQVNTTGSNNIAVGFQAGWNLTTGSHNIAELVVRDNEGRIYGVRYDELGPMLLNEVQQQQSKMAAQDAEIHDLKRQVDELKDLKQQVAVLTSAIQKLHAKDELIAQR
jgi:hypothetical protein